MCGNVEVEVFDVRRSGGIEGKERGVCRSVLRYMESLLLREYKTRKQAWVWVYMQERYVTSRVLTCTSGAVRARLRVVRTRLLIWGSKWRTVKL